MTAGLCFEVGCLNCGHELRVVNPGGTNGYETKLVTRCTGCHREYLIAARMEQISATAAPRNRPRFQESA